MSSESETRNSADAQPLAPPVPPANPPVSLESERRKAMMLVHGVEKDVHRFREIYLQNYHNPLSSDIEEFLVFVAERSETRRPPRTQEDFVRLLESVQDTAKLEFPNELHHVSVAMERVRCFHDLMTSVENRLKAALDNHVGRYCHAFSAEAEGHDITCVLEYENSIVSWRSAVGQAFALLQDVIASVAEASIPFENLVLNHDRVLQGMRRALEVLQRIYAPLKDWVSADEAYVRKLQDEAHGLLRRKVAVLEKTRRQSSQADTMKTKVSTCTQAHWVSPSLFHAFPSVSHITEQNVLWISYKKELGKSHICTGSLLLAMSRSLIAKAKSTSGNCCTYDVVPKFLHILIKIQVHVHVIGFLSFASV